MQLFDSKEVQALSDESEIEEDVRQKIREQGAFDPWRQDDESYYSSLMPNMK